MRGGPNTATWGDDDLRAALDKYQAACRRANMRDSAWRSYVDYARRFLAWREGDYWPRGTIVGDRPVPRTGATTADLRDQAQQYSGQVQAAGREQPTVETYLRHELFFIRWLEGDFQPGARLQGLR